MTKNKFPLARKSVFTSHNEGFVSKTHFHETGKKHSLARMCKKYITNGCHYPENPFPLTGMQDSIKNTFLLDEKIKLSEARASEHGRENMVSTSQKISFF